MVDRKRLRNLVLLAYDCALDPQQWNGFLSQYASALNAPAAGFTLQDVRHGRGLCIAMHGVGPLGPKRYNDYYNRWFVEVFLRRAMARAGPGQPINSIEVMGEEEWERTEFYNEYLRPMDEFYGLFVFQNLGKPRARSGSVFAARSRRGGPFGSDEIAIAQELIPHLQTAFRVNERISSLEVQLEATSETLDRAAQGVILLDATGRVVFVNRQAQDLLERGDGLTQTVAGLRASSGSESERLADMIARAGQTIAGSDSGGTIDAGGAISISRSSGLPPLQVQVTPLASPLAKRKRPAVALFITEPERTPPPNESLLEQLLGLTRAEARLVAALVKGATLQEFTSESGITMNTAKTHLKRIFVKTGASRQAELTRIALSAIGPWLPPPI